MTYEVRLQRLAAADLRRAYRRAARNAPLAALRWLDRFHRALATLEHNPQRCPLARESAKTQLELREFLFGRRPWVFRAVYIVDGQIVRVLRIRRGQRRFLTRRQIDEALGPED